MAQSGRMIDWQAHIDERDDESPAVVRSTGIAVESVLAMLADGRSIEQILACDPRLSDEAVRACIEYGIELVARQRQVAIVRRRLADAEAHPERLVPHDEVMRKMKDRLAALRIAEDDE